MACGFSVYASPRSRHVVGCGMSGVGVYRVAASAFTFCRSDRSKERNPNSVEHIRKRFANARTGGGTESPNLRSAPSSIEFGRQWPQGSVCLLYTSDAADER